MAKKGKEVGTESHVYDKEGNLQGLYTIDGAKAREEFGNERFWEGVDEIISLYRQINTAEMDQSDYLNMDTKLNTHNDTGTNKSGSNRLAMNVPYGLYLALTDYEPRIFRDKKMRTTFMTRYPVLRAVEKV